MGDYPPHQDPGQDKLAVFPKEYKKPDQLKGTYGI